MDARANEPGGELPDPTTESAIDSAWIRASDRLVRGITHDLSGHISVLAALAGFLELEAQPPDTPAGMLAAEITRLEGLLAILRAYPAERGEAGTAISPAESLPRLVRLHERGSAADRVAVALRLQPALPAASVEPNGFARALLLLLRHATDTATVLGKREVSLAASEEGDEVVIRLSVDGASGATTEGALLRAAAVMARDAGARLLIPDGRPGEAELRLPALRPRPALETS